MAQEKSTEADLAAVVSSDNEASEQLGKDARNTSKRQMLLNLWVLLGFAGIIAILIAGKSRIYEPESGFGWYVRGWMIQT